VASSEVELATWHRPPCASDEDEKLARAQAIIVALFLVGCAGQSLPQHVEWVRADSKPLASQFDLDATACRAETQKVNRLGDAGLYRKRPKQSMYLLGAWPAAGILSFDRINAERSG
jgi:hypothetical protein